jgi:endoglucanase
MKKFAFLLTFLFTIISTNETFSQAPFSRGVNLTGWFQTSSTRQIQFTKYTKKDFQNIKNLDCDVIRLPINLFYMTNGNPDYTIDPLLFDFLDQAVNWAEDLQI